MSPEQMTREECLIETGAHIARVRSFLNEAIIELSDRSVHHDESKIQEPELGIFCKFTPLLKGTDYNSEEYKSYMKQMRPALSHHYYKNRHHPEHFPEGWKGMNLIDLIEMVCDWRASSERHANGNFYKSLEENEKRFKMPKYLIQLLRNTVEYLEDKTDAAEGEEPDSSDS